MKPYQDSSVLFTDFYQLAMMQGYYEQGMNETSVFEIFVRKFPANRAFLMAAGLEAVIEYLETLRFTPEELDWLFESKRFSPGFIDYLRDMRFTGDLDGMAEGTIFFPNEPIARITAPLPVAQLVESRIINLIHFQTLIASKAARIVLAAGGGSEKILVDFGMRRAHGFEAGLFAARASYLAGFNGTATTLAGPLFGIPIYGTMAHSFVMSHDDEMQAFESFALAQPDNVIFILDTYDTELAAKKAVQLGLKLKDKGIQIKGVRLDSGDLTQHALRVRDILDSQGFIEVKIFVSGNLDEYSVAELIQKGAPIDGFGIGTRMDTSADAPYLDSAYKLQQYAGKFKRKRSEGKATLPGIKQVYRYFDNQGKMYRDLITTHDDINEAQSLLQPCMRSGKRINPALPLPEARAYAAQQLSLLPEHLKRLQNFGEYPVVISETVHALIRDIDKR
jgi:nicotinate phosphoribosyltransferase